MEEKERQDVRKERKKLQFKAQPIRFLSSRRNGGKGALTRSRKKKRRVGGRCGAQGGSGNIKVDQASQT